MGMAALTGIGLALSAAGTAASMKAASDSRRAMNNQVRRTMQQQEAFQKQASPYFTDSLDRSSRGAVDADVAASAQEASGMYGRLGQLPTSQSLLPSDGRGSAVVGNARANAAQAQGYDAAAFNRWLKNSQVGTNLGVISNLASGAAGTAPLLTQLAGQKSAKLAGMGSLMSTAGNLASIYGGINTPAAPTMGTTSSPKWNTPKNLNVSYAQKP